MVTNQELLDSAKLRLDSLKSQAQDFLKERSPTSTVELAAELGFSIQETRQVLKQNGMFVGNENDEWVLSEDRELEKHSSMDSPTQLFLLSDEKIAEPSQVFPSESFRGKGFTEKDYEAIQEFLKELPDQNTQANSTSKKETVSASTQSSLPDTQQLPQNSTMNATDRQEVKKIEQEHANVMRDSTVMVARIIQQLLAQLRQNQNLSPTLNTKS